LSDKAKLVEGEVYPFQVKGLVMPGDGLEYLILIDPFGVKHLLEYKAYEEFYLKDKSKIDCRVDKINCTGKIYLEPIHPHYKLNEIYSFKLLGYTHHKHENQHTQQVGVFEDLMKNHILISSDEMTRGLKIGEYQKFRVYKIKNGKIFLTDRLYKQDFSAFHIGYLYSFLIKDRIDRINEDPYFEIEGMDGKIYRIREKFYLSYGLKPGDTCKCMLINNGDSLFLEPEHPYFKVGKEYLFEILKKEDISVYPNLKKPAYFLKNDYGKPVVILADDVSPKNLENNHIRCTVIAIHKSKPLLSCK